MFCTSSATDMLLVPTVAILKNQPYLSINQPYLSVTHLHQPAIPFCHTSSSTAIPLHHTPPNSHTSPSTAKPLLHIPPSTNSQTSPSHMFNNKPPHTTINKRPKISITHLHQQMAKPLHHTSSPTNSHTSFTHLHQQTAIPLSHIFINKQPKVMKNKSSNSTPKTVLFQCLSIRFTKMYD